MYKQVLATSVVNEKHTADNIRSVISSVLEEFGAVRPGNVFITDNASNMKATFHDHTWLGCACHNLNLKQHNFQFLQNLYLQLHQLPIIVNIV